MEPQSTETAILGAALALFTARGFESATVADIRARAACSNGSFFHRFASKEAVAEALYRQCIDAYQRALLDRLAAVSGSAAAGIEALVRAHIDWVEGAPEQARFLFARGQPTWTDDHAAAIRRANERFRAGLETWRRPHLQAGALAPMPIAVFYAVVMGPAQMICRNWLFDGASPRPREQADHLVAAAVGATRFPTKETPP